jgi:hypothetical protein
MSRMTDMDQISDKEESPVYDIPLYKGGEKTAPASKESKRDYAMLSMSTLNKDGVYDVISSGEPV